MKTRLIPAIALFAALTGFAADPAKPDTPPAAGAAKSVRQHFVPAKFSGDNRASFSKLHPSPEKGITWLQAHAGLGEKFPVRDEESRMLFEVRVADGDDEHLVLEVIAKAGTQKVEAKRDKLALAEVEGMKFGFLFPWTEVSSADKTTTEQAMIIVTRRPAEAAK